MSKKLINPEELYDGAAFGMSQATVETELGLVFVSGQVEENTWKLLPLFFLAF